jgi:hypothetical protein
MVDAQSGASADRRVVWLALAILVIGFAIRLYYVRDTYLNPDEALHFLNANTASVLEAYRRSQTTAHPPLFLLVLHLALGVGNTEWVMRLPSLVAGTAALWLAFRWLQRIAGDLTALAGLLLLAFAPSMISTAIEVRQYGLLMFGVCGALYAMERFLDEHAVAWVAAFALSAYIAILSHYTAAVVILALGLYVPIRLWAGRAPRGVVACWAVSQLGAVALYVWLFVTHLRFLHGGGMEAGAMAGWLKPWYYSPGDGVVAFVLHTMAGAFGYLAGAPELGTLSIVLFGLGVGMIAAGWPQVRPPVRRDYALLLVLPALLGCAVAVVRLLPFGGTRHVTYLLPFVAAGIAVAVTRVLLRKLSLVVLAGVVVAPVWLIVAPPANSLNKMGRAHMTAALDYLHDVVPSNAIIYTDRETHLVLAYYLQRGQRDLRLPYSERFQETRLGDYRVVSNAEEWRFMPQTLPADIAELSRVWQLPPGQPVWVAAVGWSIGRPLDVRLPHEAVVRRDFGPITLLQTAAGYW